MHVWSSGMTNKSPALTTVREKERKFIDWLGQQTHSCTQAFYHLSNGALTALSLRETRTQSISVSITYTHKYTV